MPKNYPSQSQKPRAYSDDENTVKQSSFRYGFPRSLLLTIVVLGPLAFGQGQGPDATKQDLSELSLEQLLNVKVTSASLHEQSLKDAPGSVTVITAEDIRKFGYRTLADALAYVPGFYFTNDHTYSYLGVRGFSLPGDYDTRVIVMINGHSIADNIFEQSTWFGNDFPLDMNLVDRIEVMRGASSALYGSNGMLATINVITRRPAEATGAGVRIETDSLGGRKVQVSTTVPLPKGANLLFSTSVFNNSGAQQLYFDGFDSPQTNFGRAYRMDGEKGFHAFVDLTWGNWDFLAVEGDRVKQQPVSWGPETVFNDRGTTAEDSRGFLNVSYNKSFEGDRTLSWQTSYDSYRYRGTYHYFLDETQTVVEDNREHDYGDWIGSKLVYRTPDFAGGHLTAGADLRVDLRALINVFDVAPAQAQYMDVNHPDRNVGVFAEQEWALGPHWEVNVGARADWSWLRRSAISPRASLIYKPSSGTTLKFLASRGFKNPSTYNMFYDDGLTQIANPALRPEFVNSYEIDFTHQLTKHLRTEVNAYRYGVTDLVQQTYTSTGLIQYMNEGEVRASGISMELMARTPLGIELQSSLEIQRAMFRNGLVLPNSPGQAGKFRASMPLWRNRITVGAGIQALGQRNTYDGMRVPWVVLPEAVISTKPFAGGFQFSAGVKNLSNSFYREPAGLSEIVDSMVGNGRTFYLNMSWHELEHHADSKENPHR